MKPAPSALSSWAPNSMPWRIDVMMKMKATPTPMYPSDRPIHPSYRRRPVSLSNPPWRLAVSLVCAILSGAFLPTAHASLQTQGLWPAYWHGVMSARNLVRGPNGERIFAEFGKNGEVLREFGEATGPLSGAFVMSGNAYRAQIAAYDRLFAERGTGDAKGAFPLSPDAYTATPFTTLDGQPVTNKPGLRSATKSVLVRHANALLTPATSPLLLQSTIDLQNRVTLDPSIRAVLLNTDGQVLEQSTTNIGFRAAYVKPKAAANSTGAPSNCSPSYGPEQDTRRFRSPGTDDACGPIRGALITTDVSPGREGGTFTDEKGKYLLSYVNMSCPGFDIEYTHYFIPKLYYSVFNPRSPRGIGTYYELHKVYDWCFGSFANLGNSTTLSGQATYLNIIGILAAQATPDKRLDIRIDVLALTGKGRLINGEGAPVPLGDTTEYTTDLPRFTPGNPQALDLDGDRNPDTVIDLANETPIDPDTRLPETIPPGTVAVYLGTNTPQRDPDTNALLATWDLTRRQDTQPDLTHQGLLSTLSEADLADTDLYVYRTSNDQLIFSRKGLDPNRDTFLRGQGGGALDNGTAGLFYHSMIRGPVFRSTFFGDDFRTWQGKAGMNPDLFERKSDQLRVGETIKIIAINRKTGYIGTVTTPVGNAASGAIGEGRIDFAIPDIILRPPNLKVSVKRGYDIKAGLTKGEERNYLVGFEGSGLSSDKTLTLTTEWLDADGTPLPETLPGYTARLAKIVSDRKLSDSLVNFPIKPGTYLQFLRLPGDTLFGNDHFYVHVSGEPEERNPDFSSIGAGAGVLQSRPAHYVPIKVPMLDEVETRRRRNAQRYAKQDKQLDPKTAKADAVYAWVYRPEMQFSVLELAVKAIERTTPDGTVISVLDAPIITPDDQLLKILYDLKANPKKPLQPLGYADSPLAQQDSQNTTGREHVFGLGGDEGVATFGPGQTLIFDNLDHLGRLQSSDYLAIQLSANTDSENILWEFSFNTINLITDRNRDGEIIKVATAANRHVDISADPKKPFYFWVNDDEDAGEIDERAGAVADIPGAAKPNAADDKVNGMRDLVDFFPVFVDVKQALGVYPPGSYTYRLRQADGALKFFESRQRPVSSKAWERPNALIKDTTVATEKSAEPVSVITPRGVPLSPGFLLNTQAEQGGIIYVEASAATKAPLMLEIIDNATGNIMARTELALSIDQVEAMYRHINLQAVAAQRGAAPIPGLPENLGEPGNNPDTNTRAKYFVFIHGFNVSGQAARGWNAETFKRLYQLGFNGRFIGVTWHGNTTPDYHHAVYNAFVTSPFLAQKVNAAMGAQPGPVVVAAHSLGNILASNAIANEGLKVEAYYMINAASPIEAYDSFQKVDVSGTTMATNMTEATWMGYPRELYSANWHALFPGSDQRSKLTWKDLFSGAIPVAYNFYSPGDEVVENAVEGETVNKSLLDRIGDIMNGQGTGRHAWVTQEIAKGCKNFIAGWFVFDNCSAGWNYNDNDADLAFVGKEDPSSGVMSYLRYSADEAQLARQNGDLADEALAQFGFFSRFRHFAGGKSQYKPLYAPTATGGANLGSNRGDAETASAVAADKRNRWDLLASGIPAMSFAAAANGVANLKDPLTGETRNFNMEAMRKKPVQWPVSRSALWKKNWLHSDIRNVALPYIYPVFDKMLELGGFSE